MPSPKLISIITALLLAAGVTGANAQEISVEQLLEIERLILAKDLDALLVFLRANPHLYVGDDPLAEELRFLVSQLEGDILEQLQYSGGPTVEFSEAY